MNQKKNFKKNLENIGYRTPDKFKQKLAVNVKRNVAMTARPRCLGGHN